ncbi:MAG: ClC family H(+)/Cl(-) exchange transporter [Eubacteriales bacterium]|nr:ClC family H(+)/Cl(-) exchange transporter [Eubacteriales bacterium]
MKEKERTTYRKIEYSRKESIYLIVRGLEVGVVAGLVSVLYRYSLSFAESGLMRVIDFVKGNPLKIAVWFVVLALIGVGISFLNKWEPMAAGSGIPQVNGEIKGNFNPSWIRIILCKFIGGTASVFSGLSLGREGPSVQLGGMAAKGVARLTKADRTTELRMISCGAGAGMAAAFNAPLTGIMFVLEEIHRTFDKNILCMGIVSAITADFISKLFFGQSTTFNYDTVNFPLRYYWLLALIGVILGISGALYNLVMVKAQDIYKSIKAVPNYIKMPIVFVFSGIVGLVMPQILCGGHTMSEMLLSERPTLTYTIILLVCKFLFGVISFACGAPGGTLYPLCVLGAYLGAVFGLVSMDVLNLGPEFYEEFVVIGMAGFFSSIVRSPITGIVLVYELTGNMNNILPLATVSLISYATANLMGVSPIYESLLERILKNNDDEPEFHLKDEKVLREFIVPMGSPIDRKTVSSIDWGKHCLVVSVERDGVSVTPKGDTMIKEGDELVILVSQRHLAKDTERLDRIING